MLYLEHVGFMSKLGSCDLDQNSFGTKVNKMANHWGSFLTLYGFTKFGPFLLHKICREGVGVINRVIKHCLCIFDIFEHMIGCFEAPPEQSVSFPLITEICHLPS